jgi:hypothetical protein
MRGERGSGTEVEFTTAVIIFMAVFWFIYLQLSYTMVIKTHRTDFIYPTADFLSDRLIKEAGSPKNWTNYTDMTVLGLAFYDGKENPGILDVQKLDAIDGQWCNSKLKMIEGLNFTLEVNSTDGGGWKCLGSQPLGNPMVTRPVYVRYTNGSYYAGTIKVRLWPV